MSRSLLGFRLIRRKELDRLRAQVSGIQEESQAQLAELTRQLRAAEDDLRAARDDLRAAQDKYAALEQAARSRADPEPVERRALPDPAPPAQFPPGGAEDGPPSVVRELVSMADKLVELTGVGAPSDPRQASAALRWLERRTQALLAVCDVMRIEDSGPLDLQRHEVIASRAAPGEDLVDHIADTVRPGYAWHGSLLRPQQVIAYIPAEEATGY